MRLLPLSCCILALLGGKEDIPLSPGRIHQLSVPAGTLIVVIECINHDDPAQFTNCMNGPKYLCRPFRPNRIAAPLLPGDLDRWVPDPTQRVPGQPGWDDHEYICRALPPGCRTFDEDGDGDVDLFDWAERTWKHSWKARQ